MPGNSGYVGRFCSNTELVFYIQSPNALRYSNIASHAQVEQGPANWTISWEDGTDSDYDDLVVRVDIVQPPAAVGGVASFAGPGEGRSSSSASRATLLWAGAGIAILVAAGVLVWRRHRYR